MISLQSIPLYVHPFVSRPHHQVVTPCPQFLAALRRGNLGLWLPGTADAAPAQRARRGSSWAQKNGSWNSARTFWVEMFGVFLVPFWLLENNVFKTKMWKNKKWSFIWCVPSWMQMTWWLHGSCSPWWIWGHPEILRLETAIFGVMFTKCPGMIWDFAADHDWIR